MERSAREFALHAHRGQMFGRHLYGRYLENVVAVLDAFGYDQRWQDAGWLHATLGKTAVTHAELRRNFGDWIVNIVDACTRIGLHARRYQNQTIYASVNQFPDAAILLVGERIAELESAERGSFHMDVLLQERAEFFCHIGHRVKLSMQTRLASAYTKKPIHDGIS